MNHYLSNEMVHDVLSPSIEESALKDLTNPFNLDILADGKVVYGKEVLDRDILKRYDIQPKASLKGFVVYSS